MSEYTVTSKRVEPQRAAILRRTIESYAKVGSLFKAVHQALDDAGIVPAGPQLAIYFDEDYTPQNVDVAAAVPVSAGVRTQDLALQESDPLAVDELPGGLMVSVVRSGPFDDFRPAYQAVMEWVKANGYAIAGPNREIYLRGPGAGVAPEAYQIEIQFPIVKAS